MSTCRDRLGGTEHDVGVICCSDGKAPWGKLVMGDKKETHDLAFL